MSSSDDFHKVWMYLLQKLYSHYEARSLAMYRLHQFYDQIFMR